MKPPGAVSPAQEMFRVGTCMPAAQAAGLCAWGTAPDVHYAEDCIWQEKGVQENSDTEAKNLNKWDLNNRFS